MGQVKALAVGSVNILSHLDIRLHRLQMIVIIMAPPAHRQKDVLHLLDLAGEKLVLVFDIFALQIMG